MPYNTRRKSLSLPSLGIHIPVTHASRVAAQRASPHNSSSNSSQSRHTSPGASSLSSLSSSSEPSSPTSPSMAAASSSAAALHPNKKVKRSHGRELSLSSRTTSASHLASNSVSNSHVSRAAAAKAAKSAASVADVSTPPPSPKPVQQASEEMDFTDDIDGDISRSSSGRTEFSLKGINDDIVEAVMMQLHVTDNRPHLIKELSAILMCQLKSVQQSANPCAIISSRLATFMKRPCWSTAKPCPLAKELEAIHPRRTYYFLTSRRHLPLPDASSTSQFIMPRISIVTPPLSSAASASESAEEERRRELSPSPEVDLSSPEFDDLDDDFPMPGTPGGPFSGRFPRLPAHYVGRHHHHYHRGASPPLEKDEKEFTQTAEGLQKRKLAGQTFSLSSPSASTPSAAAARPSPESHTLVHSIEGENEDHGREESLFGVEPRHLSVSGGNMFSLMASPAMRPTFSFGPKRDVEASNWDKFDHMLDWDRNPENVALEELDGLLDDF